MLGLAFQARKSTAVVVDAALSDNGRLMPPLRVISSALLALVVAACSPAGVESSDPPPAEDTGPDVTPPLDVPAPPADPGTPLEDPGDPTDHLEPPDPGPSPVEDVPTPADEEVGEPDPGPVAPYCEPLTRRCLTDLIAQQCTVTGSHWLDEICESGERCWEAECAPIICTAGEPGEGLCATPNGPALCNPVGTGWLPDPCPGGETCFEGECVDWTCPPGAVSCLGMTAVQACTDGSAWDIVELCEPGGGCAFGACLTACELADLAGRTLACDFVVAAPRGFDAALSVLGATLLIGVPSDSADAVVSVVDLASGEPLAEPISIYQGTSEVVALPATIAPPGPQLGGAGVRVISTAPIALQIVSGSSTVTHDLATVAPTAAAGTDFIVPGWATQSDGVDTRAGWVTVLAATPDTTTTVTVTPRAELAGGGGVIAVKPGQPVSYELLYGQALHLETIPQPKNDLTGTVIQATAPVALFAGHECARVPEGVGACNQLHEQVPPLDQWGSRVLAVPFQKRTATQFDVWRVVAGAEEVIVQTDPPRPGYAVVTLQRGGYVTFHGTEPFEITANGPILVSHFVIAAEYPDHGPECAGKGTGDPAWALEVPVQQYTRRAVLSTASGQQSYHADVVHPDDATLWLDGAPVNVEAEPIGETGYSATALALSEGTHLLTSSRRVGVVSYGYGCGGSYASAGGARVWDLTPPPNVWSPPAANPPPPPPFVGFPQDEDGDEVLDDVDNCVGVANPDQTDSDGDSLGDACDPDKDGDGAPNVSDCAPTDPTKSPLTPESCDGADNDCDELVDEEDALGCTDYFVDVDGDLAGNAGFPLCLCAPVPPYQVLFGGDCIDNDPFVNPWVAEKCDNLDNDCNGAVDEGCDDDLDGWCDGNLTTVGAALVCPSGGGDCLDYSALASPGLLELPDNGVDDDCDGLTDDETEADQPPDCTGIPCQGQSLQAVLCSAELCFGPDFLLDVELASPTDSPIDESFSAVAHLGDAGNDLSPKAGASYLVLSTGKALSTGPHDVVLGGTPVPDPFPNFAHDMHDSVELVLTLIAPAGATGFRVDSLFLSAAFEEDIGKAASDKFYVIVNGPLTTGGEDRVVNHGPCVQPAQYSDTTIDGAPACFIDVNSAFGEACLSPQITNIAGTGYECAGGPGTGGGSSTGWLRTVAAIHAEELFTLRLHIHDTQTGGVDSAVLVDNFRWLSGAIEPGTSALPHPENLP